MRKTLYKLCHLWTIDINYTRCKLHNGSSIHLKTLNQLFSQQYNNSMNDISTQHTTLWILEHNSNKQNLCQPMRMTSYPHLLWNNHIKINHINAHHILLGLGSYVMWTDVIPCFTGKWLAIQPRIKIERETVCETRPESRTTYTSEELVW